MDYRWETPSVGHMNRQARHALKAEKCVRKWAGMNGPGNDPWLIVETNGQRRVATIKSRQEEGRSNKWKLSLLASETDPVDGRVITAPLEKIKVLKPPPPDKCPSRLYRLRAQNNIFASPIGKELCIYSTSTSQRLLQNRARPHASTLMQMQPGDLREGHHLLVCRDDCEDEAYVICSRRTITTHKAEGTVQGKNGRIVSIVITHEGLTVVGDALATVRAFKVFKATTTWERIEFEKSGYYSSYSIQPGYPKSTDWIESAGC